MSRVTVVVPTYNRSGVLFECLAALEAQQCDVTFDVIVVDDGSTDGTADAVARFQASSAMSVAFLRQENLGPASARNRGVESARGDLVLFLGDDIVVQPGHLDEIYRTYVERDGGPRAIVGFTSYRDDCVSTPFGHWLDRRSGFQFQYPPDDATGPLPFTHFYTSNVLVPRDALLDVGGFNSGFRRAAHEDTELAFRLAHRGVKLYFCPTARALHVHRVSVESTALRMRMVAHEAITLHQLNPALFNELYPHAEGSFGQAPFPRNLLRSVAAGPLVSALNVWDQTLRLTLPDVLYRVSMTSAFSAEMSRNWRAGKFSEARSSSGEAFGAPRR